MKPVMQNKFGNEGNCFSACVASMLEIGIDDVPIFYQKYRSGWWIEFEKWLLDFGYFPIVTQHQSMPIYYIASGISPRGYSHSVIYFNDKLVHDPYPGGGGIEKINNTYLFIPVEIKRGI